MKKILIAIQSELLVQTLIDNLSSTFDIQYCYNGEDALQYLYDTCPDILVLDLMLPKIDGVSVLHAAFAAGIRPQVIAVSDYIPADLIATLEKMTLQALIKMPLNIDILVAKIFEVSKDYRFTQDIHRQMWNVLALLGFKINTGGSIVLEHALCEYIKDPHQQLINQLYPAVVKVCGGNVSQVEKAIRDTIKTAWSGRNEVIWRLYFATGKDGKVKKPTNAEFFARIANCIANTQQFECEQCTAHKKSG